eukprot:scaffold22575_cov141-Cylindrotheca_fusiformis.AAC.16
MILTVGPGTPASVVMTPSSSESPSSSSSSSSAASSPPSHSEGRGDASDIEEDSSENESRSEEEEHGENEERIEPQGRSRWERRQIRNRNDTESDDASNGQQVAESALESALLDWYADGSESESDYGYNLSGNPKMAPVPVPSMRHGGCINTAAWMDCGWRVSTAGNQPESLPCEDCPTQLITSGDDHFVKVWDVRHGMGSTNPLPGGCSTICPFSAPTNCPRREDSRKRWKEHYEGRKTQHIAGTVLPLAVVHTGHRGNVFHVTPIVGKPGKVATCGADGFLRVSDLQTGDSSVVVSPEFGDDLDGLLPAGLLHLRAGMCFSHHFLNQNTGLLCSERGLRRFDLRLPAREQSTQSLLGGRFKACKACAIWSSPETSSSLEEGDSVYVFAGGSSAGVILYDLRMADGASKREVRRYRPSSLVASNAVSVSGLDLSRDKQELLVSYESDQIYTFPVFPQIKSPAGPNVDDLRSMADEMEHRNPDVVREFAAYGGHLNRFTFLKNAKYAGPKDEYICTGSDSGHAWIYEKSTGSVVSLLKADNSTCNGVIPHPTLPMFVTYGIDSTAKLWRATNPVDSEIDDSPKGRLECYSRYQYEMSPIVRKWGEVQQILKLFGSEHEWNETHVFPDSIPSTNVVVERGMFGRRSGFHGNGEQPRICNDLHNLPNVLKHNLYACTRPLLDGDDLPVESDIEDLKHRISLMRLRHQADRLGLQWNPQVPWRLEKGETESVHSADLIPDSPSDWIPYDPEMTKAPWDFKNYFNTKDYGDILPASHFVPPERFAGTADENVRGMTLDTQCGTGKDIQSIESDNSGAVEPQKTVNVSSSKDDGDHESKYVLSCRTLLHKTMVNLKDAGNEALQAKNLDLAARRYDKAIQYGAVASMTFPCGNLNFAKGGKEKLKMDGLEWTPLIKVLIICRLNLALLMLKPYFGHPNRAAEQARLALLELKPFCCQKGKVMKGSKANVSFCEHVPETTYIEAVGFQAKAYFRLGSAHYDMGEYGEAVRFFECSVKSTQQSNAVPDNLVLRRLSEAKRESKRRSKRQKRFKFSFTEDDMKEGDSS